MKQYKALMIKEWQTHKATILIPVWFTSGAILITLLGMLINLIQGNSIIFQGELPVISALQTNLILWGGNRAGVSMLGFIGMVTAIILGDAMLNGGFKRRCEIFHLSQPVTYAGIVTAKYAMMILSVIAQVFVIGLAGSLVATAYVSNLLHASFLNGMIGFWQGFIDFLFSFVFVSSLFWFFAGAFKRKPFFMAVLILGGIQIATIILNKVAGLSIPSLTGHLIELASMSTTISFGSHSMMPADFSELVKTQWSGLLSLNVLLKVIYSVVFFIGGFLCYRRREIA